jgi:hypothetical protein
MHVSSSSYRTDFLRRMRMIRMPQKKKIAKVSALVHVPNKVNADLRIFFPCLQMTMHPPTIQSLPKRHAFLKRKKGFHIAT